MAFAVWAISQGTSCSQPCVLRATKAFLFELSENSPSCPLTQEHSEPPVAIVVEVFRSHRSPASSKELQAPHSGIIKSSLARSPHRTPNTSTRGPTSRSHSPDISFQPSRCCLSADVVVSPLNSTRHCLHFATALHDNCSGEIIICSIILDSTVFSLMEKQKKPQKNTDKLSNEVAQALGKRLWRAWKYSEECDSWPM